MITPILKSVARRGRECRRLKVGAAPSMSTSPEPPPPHESSTAKGVRPEHIVRTAAEPRSGDMLRAVITNISELSPTVKGFSFEVERRGSGGTAAVAVKPSFLAGQWVDFFIPGVDQIGGYSMCSAPSDLAGAESRLDLAVKASTWAPAAWMHNRAKVGDVVQMRVGGGFCYPNEKTRSAGNNHRLILIAGGVGINPIVSIMREIDRASYTPQKVSLLYSAKSREELIFRDDIDDICERRAETFTANYFVTGDDKRAEEGETKVICSRIDAGHLARALALSDDDGMTTRESGTFCYICGPNSLTEDSVAALTSLGVPKENVFYELWW